jgi:O-antigen/teichoic acid export membrane protein
MVFLRGASGVARVILFLLIAKRFGASDLGRFALVYSFVEIFKAVSDTGVDTVLLRRFSLYGPVAESRVASESLVNHALTAKLVLATAGYACAVLVFPRLYPSVAGLPLVLILGLSIYTTFLVNLFTSTFQAQLRTVDVLPASLAGTSAYLVLTLLGLYEGWSLVTLAAIIPISELINVVWAARIYGRAASVGFGLDRRIITGLVKESFPIGLSGFMIILYMRMDHLLLGWYQGASAVGEYSAAFRIAEPVMLIFTSLSLSLYAFLSSSKSLSQPQTKRVVVRVMTFTFVFTLGVAVVLALFSRTIMGLVFKSYLSPAIALSILGGAIIFKAINAQLTAMINAQGRYTVITKVALFNLLINLSVALLLVPRYGVIGAATSVIITEAINTVVQGVYVARFLGVATQVSEAA